MMSESDLDRAMSALARCVGKAGSQAAFERRTGIRQQTISKRLKKRIPLQSEREVDICHREFGEARHDLRPDLYPLEDSPPARHPAEQPPADAPTPTAGGSSSSDDGIEGIAA